MQRFSSGNLSAFRFPRSGRSKPKALCMGSDSETPVQDLDRVWAVSKIFVFNLNRQDLQRILQYLKISQELFLIKLAMERALLPLKELKHIGSPSEEM